MPVIRDMADERAVLDEHQASFRNRDRGCLFFALVPLPAIFGLIGGCSAFVTGFDRVGWGALAAALVGFAIGVWLLRAQHQTKRMRVAQVETEGEPRLLYLWGPYLDSLLAGGAFPCREFRLVRALDSDKTILALHPVGDRLAGEDGKFVNGFDEALERMPDGSLFPGSLDTLERDYRAWLAGKAS